MDNFRVDVTIKGEDYQLIRELDDRNIKDINEAARNGKNLDDFHRVGKYKNRSGFIYYFYI